MNDTTGLKIRDIFHFRYGICQMIFFSRANCWVGLNEKKETLWAPNANGGPDMERVRKPHYIYREQVAYLQILNSYYQPECTVLDMDRERDTIA